MKPKNYTPIGIIVDKSPATEEFIDDNYRPYPSDWHVMPYHNLSHGEIKEIERELKEKKDHKRALVNLINKRIEQIS